MSTPPTGARASNREPVLIVSPTIGYATWPWPPISRRTTWPLFTPMRSPASQGDARSRWQTLAEAQVRRRGTRRVVGLVAAAVEDGHDAVADELLDLPAELG